MDPCRGVAVETAEELIGGGAPDRLGILCHDGDRRLHHIGVGRTHAGTHVLLLVQDLDVRIVDAATGELLRELTIDPNRDYQPTGRPRPQPK